MRSGWLRLVQTAAAGLTLAVGVWAQGAGAAEVKNVKATYLWPWGRVGISYEVGGKLPDGAILTVMATNRTQNVTFVAASNALSGDMGSEEELHRIVWNLEKQGINIQSSNVTFTVTYYDAPLYCVVDLSAGAKASLYPVTYLHAPPSGGFNTDEYKTTKLVLKRVNAGTFKMGAPLGESGREKFETQHQVTLTKPYYIGVFEVTQKQWKLVMGSNPSKFSGDKRPVEQVSWDAIRGDSETYNWPESSAVDANSFIGRLRARTGLEFDLPTEAQWEYACRAGRTTAYSYGVSENGDYMWYSSNSSSQTHEVGTKKPNEWELYDMHGNVREWCLDAWSDFETAAVVDPKGGSSGGTRVFRGGDWDRFAGYCRSASRSSWFSYSTDDSWGFRLSRTLSK